MSRLAARRFYNVYLLVLAALVVAASASAADLPSYSIKGVVINWSGAPVAGATIAVDGRTVGSTDDDGRFSFDLAPGEWKILVRHPAHQSLQYRLTVDGNVSELRLKLVPAMSVTESITVTAIRAGEEVPVTKRNLDREEIEKLSYGQDIPALLQYTPSMTWYSDSVDGSKQAKARADSGLNMRTAFGAAVATCRRRTKQNGRPGASF